MHDYMKALYHRFETPSERAESLEETTNKVHKQLAKQLGQYRTEKMRNKGKCGKI